MVVVAGILPETDQRWHRSPADERPLQVRWQEAARAIEALGGAPTYPISEENVFAMKQAALVRQPIIADDPALAAVNREHFELRHRYQRAVIAIIDLQRRVPGALADWRHRLLDDIPRNWNVDLPRVLRDTEYGTPAAVVRKEITAIMPSVLAAEALASRLETAMSVNQRDAATLHGELIEKLFARHEAQAQQQAQTIKALVERIENLEVELKRRRKAK